MSSGSSDSAVSRSIRAILHRSIEQLGQAGINDSPRLDAELLLSHAIKKNREYLFTWPEKTLETNTYTVFDDLLQQRLDGTPIAYILGEQEFWSLPFYVTHDTLIPRPETEHLIEIALAAFARTTACRVLDLGTGSGCISIALAYAQANWHISALNQSPKALEVAKKNAERNQVDVTFLHSDWFSALEPRSDFDLIISNPPYICDHDPHLSQGDVRFEPRSALASGEDGLDDIRLIAKQAKGYLKKHGMLLMEFGYDQSEEVHRILEQEDYRDIALHKDLSGIVRAVSART